jgi:hypothetical protein
MRQARLARDGFVAVGRAATRAMMEVRMRMRDFMVGIEQRRIDDFVKMMEWDGLRFVMSGRLVYLYGGFVCCPLMEIDMDGLSLKNRGLPSLYEPSLQ